MDKYAAIRAALDGYSKDDPLTWQAFWDAVTLDTIRALLAERDAALQSQPSDGWKEAFKAWKVCASIHREWAKGKDAVFTTRQADFVRHAEVAFKKSMGEDGLQSQDREDVKRLDWLDAQNARKNGQNGTRYGWGYSENHNRIALEDHQWPPRTVREAIDHARRIEGEA